MKNNGIFKTVCLQSWLILAFVFGLISTPAAADVLINNQGKFGFADENGKLIVGYKYSYIGSFDENGLALVMKGSKCGMINRDGVEILPAIYDNITEFDHGVAQIKKGKKVGLIDANARIILKPTYLEIGKFNSQNITWATKDKNKINYSVIDITGKEIIPVKGGFLLSPLLPDDETSPNNVYQNSEFREVYAFLSNKKAKGNSDTLDISNGYILHTGMSFNKHTYYDFKGKEIFNANIFNNIYQDVFLSKYSASNSSSLYQSLVINEGIMLLTTNKFNGKKENTYTIAYIYYDLEKQNIIRSYTHQVSSAYIKDLEKHNAKIKTQALMGKSVENLTKDFQNLTNNFIQSIPHIVSYPFKEGFARITFFDGNETKDVIINTSGKEVAKYKKATDYQNGRMIVQDQNDLFGIVDNDQNFLVPAIYDSICEPKGDFYVVNSGEKYGTINVQNDTLVPIIYDDIVLNDQGITCANAHNKWYVYQIDTIAYQCTDDIEPLLYNGASAVLLLQKDSTIQVYDILTKKHTSVYSGCTNVLIAPSVHGGLCFEVFQETKGSKLYGYVNAHAEIVVPIVFENVDWAKKTYKEYKELPAATFTEIDVYRVRLHHTLRERTYELNSIIPNSDWDY